MINIRFIIIALLVLTFSFQKSFSSDTLKLPLRITIFDNGTKLPGGNKLLLMNLPIHPGITVGTEYFWNKKKKQWFQSAVLGYFYHQYSQHAIQIYTELGYRYHCKIRLAFEGKIGLGYLHSIPATEIYNLDANGTYQRTNRFGRIQFMLPMVSFGAAHRLRGTNISLFFNYQFWLQLPFVKQYVPVLPNTAFHIGVNIPLNFNK